MPNLQEPTTAENAWIGEQLNKARDFVASHGSATDLRLESLDAAWGEWLATGESDTERINAVINAVGIAFGQALADATLLKWVIATDEHGTDLALFGLPGHGDVLVYPANLVAKRWERRESGFLVRTYLEISQQVEQLAASPPSRKPWWKVW